MALPATARQAWRPPHAVPGRRARHWPARALAAPLDDGRPPDGSLFIFGLGYTGQGLARLALAQGWTVAGSVRSPEKAADLSSKGLLSCVLEPSAPPPPALTAATHLVVTAPPDGGGRDPVLALFPHLRSVAPHARWLGYVSSTSVYGSERGGAWVDERDPRSPDSPPGLARAAAEREWEAWAATCDPVLPVVCFRAGGIYGPARSALDAAAKKTGTGRRAAQPDAPTSRVHVLDLCRGLLASAARPPSSAWSVINAVDGDPAPRSVVLAAAHALLDGRRVEEADEAAPGGPACVGKRVREDAFAELLAPGGGLVFGSYREGLTAIARKDGRPFVL